MTQIDEPGPSTRSTSPMSYHVFLSFRGDDTRKSFTDHLYFALRRKGIVTFRDDEDLQGGEIISEKLLQSIEQSLFAVVVLSKNFASSSWCLNELQKIVESKQDKAVFPIFYDVDPSHIRKQKEDVAKNFEEHERGFSVDKVQGWREALTKVANFSGWHTKDKHEAEIVEDIAKSIWNKLCDELPYDSEHLVGDIQSKVDTIVSLSKIGLDEKCFIGILGMGGIGKTTLARLVYNAIRGKFDASCFLANVRTESESPGIVSLQKKLLSDLGLREPKINDSNHGGEVIRNFVRRKKVLIVLDDVNHEDQLENLARNEQWFGAGSKIIITTRDVQLLRRYEKFERYEVRGLNPEESLKLLCQKAFKKNEPKEGYLDLSKEVVKYACGLPLALEVLGSFLCGRTHSEWRETLDKCRKKLDKDIFSLLHISYDGLKDEDCKSIFLDIACFFNGKSKFYVTNILKTCGHYPVAGINVLIEKSLLSSTQSNSNSRQNAEDQDIHDMVQKTSRDTFLSTSMYHKLLEEASKERLYMHDLLQEMGRNIVLQESLTDAGSRSRLWTIEDIDLVLKGNEGTKNVQSIVLDPPQYFFNAYWHPDCFSKMQNLTLLDLSGALLSHGLNSLPSKLKCLRWAFYALESLPSIDHLHELESLELCISRIRKLWDGTLVDNFLYKLRIIDLSNSNSLMETPDFTKTPNLEKLLLNSCQNLLRVHKSVGQLKKLVELSLEDCTNLESLPTYLEMNNLKVFILGNCSKLEKLPKFSRSMIRLYFLDVRGTKITEFPSSIIRLINLKYLNLSSWQILKSIPELPPNLFICASNYPFLKSTSDLQYLIASCVSKGPIHLFSDLGDFHSTESNVIQRWFKGQKHRRSQDDSGEVVTITADIPCDIADYEGERWAIAVCIVFEFLFELGTFEVGRGFSINWEFQDYCHPDNKDDFQKHPSGIRSEFDASKNIHSQVYTGFYPIEKKNCRRHPSGVGSQIDLTLHFPDVKTTNYVTVGSKKRHFSNLEVVNCGWRLVCNKDLDATSSDFEEWRFCINRYLAITKYQLYGHETLQLVDSKIKELWDGAPFLDKLRIIALESCYNLTETPDFRGTPNLEMLLLRYCRRLDRVHESVGQLKKLVELSLDRCKNLVTLPSYLEIDNLEKFILHGCSRLEKLPEFGKNMKKLHFFDLGRTSIIEIPLSIIHLTNLKKLCLTCNDKLKSIPELPPNLIIDASGCPLLEPTSAVPQLFASNASKGPIHLFNADHSPWIEGIGEHHWSKESSGEVVVTLTADIPCDVADFEGECWAIAVCIAFDDVIGEMTNLLIHWKFEDYCHSNSNNNKSHVTPSLLMGGSYVGLYPIDKGHCQPYPSGVGSQIHLTLSFQTTEYVFMGKRFPSKPLEIRGCVCRLVCKKDVDEWSASSTSDFHTGGSMPSSIYCLHSQRSSVLQRKQLPNEGPSTSRHGRLNRRDREESSISVTEGRQEENTQDLKNDSVEDFDADTPIPSSISLPALPAEIDKNMDVEECGRSPVDKKDFDAERSIPSSSSFITLPKLPEIDSFEIEECERSLADKKDLDAERSIPSSTSLPATPGLQTTPRKTYRRILFFIFFPFLLDNEPDRPKP